MVAVVITGIFDEILQNKSIPNGNAFPEYFTVMGMSIDAKTYTLQNT